MEQGWRRREQDGANYEKERGGTPCLICIDNITTPLWHGFFLLHVAALIMADLVWLNERLASDNEKTEATWELLRTMHHWVRIAIQAEVLVHGGSQRGGAPNIFC
jgi:hypothetical protein